MCCQEVILNIPTLRWANALFEPLWSRHHSNACTPETAHTSPRPSAHKVRFHERPVTTRVLVLCRSRVCAVTVESVQITFTENLGTGGRGGYFDGFGIVRDIIQNHLLQAFMFLGMEPPEDMSAGAITDAKVCCHPTKMSSSYVLPSH